MLDYIFFREASRDQFVDFLDEQGVGSQSSDDPHMGFLVHVPMLETDKISDVIEQRYELLSEADEAHMAEEDDDNQVAALTVTLRDGTTSYAPLKPEMMNRLLSALSPDEIGELVDAIAKAVEQPERRGLCHIAAMDE